MPDISSETWASLAPRQIRLADLSTIKSTLDLNELLASDSTFFGDLFAHVVRWNGQLYLEDGLHRAVRAALQGRTSLHARVYEVN
jgi:Arc/MetJ family transcription regulator